MVGAIIGDIVGSIYEFDNIKTKEFELFDKECNFTDDTVMTLAVGKAIHDYKGGDFKKHLIETMHEVGNEYPDCGYGGLFLDWMIHKETKPYNSFGNGSAMRVSAVGWYAKTLEEAEELAKLTAEVTHNHPEGIKGAVSVAGAIWLARNGKTKDEIRKYVSQYYTLNFTLDEIRPTYDYEITCQKSVPQAIQAFLEAEGFEDAIRNAISIGGDSDTVAAITGSIAEAFYGVDDDIKETALSYLDDYLLDIYEEINRVRN
jgi:type I restriction enzyme M protein